MENIDWRLVFEGVSTLSRALPKNDKLRRWVILGGLALVAVATAVASQQEKQENPGE